MAEAIADPESKLSEMLVFLLSFLVLLLIYQALAPHFMTLKQSSWIITTLSSFIMFIASLPFVIDLLSHGGNVKGIRTMSVFSLFMNRFFQAYLCADLFSGALYYRSHVSLSTGWIHHIVYLFVVEVAIRGGWAHIFCLCAVMEFPTFLLGIASLFPRLRSNILFALSFFLTRIILHIFLAVSYLLPEHRHQLLQDSYTPSILLACAFPMHAIWFYGCLNGFIKRAKLQSRPLQRVNSNTVSLVPLLVVAQRNVSAKLSVRRHRQRLREYVPTGWVMEKWRNIGGRENVFPNSRQWLYERVGLGRPRRRLMA